MLIQLYHWTEKDRVHSIEREGLRRCSWQCSRLVTWACSGDVKCHARYDASQAHGLPESEMVMFELDVDESSVLNIYAGYYHVFEDIPPQRLRRCRVVRGNVEVMRCRENTG
jgi:hypothetical protein